MVDSENGDVVLVVVVCEVVVFVDSKTMPLMRCCSGLPGAPILIGLESRLVPLMRDNSSSSKGLTPAKSEELGSLSCLPRTLKGAAEEVGLVVNLVVDGVIRDNSMGGGRPLGVAGMSDKRVRVDPRVVVLSFFSLGVGIS